VIEAGQELARHNPRITRVQMLTAKRIGKNFIPGESRLVLGTAYKKTIVLKVQRFKQVINSGKGV